MMKFGRLTAPLLVAIASAESSEHVNYAFLAQQRVKAAHGATSSSSTAAAMASRVAGEVGYAERAVEAELRKEHAPIALQQQEKRLLDGALKAANGAAHATKHEEQLKRSARSSQKSTAKSHSVAGLEAKAAVGAERIVKKLNRVEAAVEAQLEKDHAPAELRAEEASLLSQAAKAESGAESELKSLLRSRRTQKKVQHKAVSALVSEKAGSSMGAMAARVAHEVSNAERAVETELKKEHAPVALQQEEKKLLDGALEAADKMAHRHMTNHKKAASGTTQTSSLRSMAAELVHSMSEDKSRLQETKFVEGQAMKALKEEHVDSAVQQQVASLLRKAESMEKKELVVAQKDLKSVHAIERQELKQKQRKGKAASAVGMEERFNHEMRKLAKADESRAEETNQIEVAAKKALEEVNADGVMEKKVQDLLQQAEASERREAAIASGSVSRTKATVSKAQMDKQFSQQMNKLAKEERNTLKATESVEQRAQQALEAAGADDAVQSQVKGLLEQAEIYEKKDIQLTTKGSAAPRAAAAAAGLHKMEKSPEDHSSTGVLRLTGLQKENTMLREENKRLRKEHAELIQEVHLEAEITALRAQNKVLTRQNTQLDEKLDNRDPSEAA